MSPPINGLSLSGEALRNRGGYIADEIRDLCKWAQHKTPEIASGARDALQTIFLATLEAQVTTETKDVE